MGFKCLVMGYDISKDACDNCSVKCKFNFKGVLHGKKV